MSLRMSECKEFSGNLTEEERMFLIFAFFFQVWSKLSEEEREKIFNV